MLHAKHRATVSHSQAHHNPTANKNNLIGGQKLHEQSNHRIPSVPAGGALLSQILRKPQITIDSVPASCRYDGRISIARTWFVPKSPPAQFQFDNQTHMSCWAHDPSHKIPAQKKAKKRPLTRSSIISLKTREKWTGGSKTPSRADWLTEVPPAPFPFPAKAHQQRGSLTIRTSSA